MIRPLIILAVLAASGATASAQEADHLAPLSFLIGSCWSGVLENGRTDTHCFNAVYGGRHVRDVHEVEGVS